MHCLPSWRRFSSRTRSRSRSMGFPSSRKRLPPLLRHTAGMYLTGWQVAPFKVVCFSSADNLDAMCVRSHCFSLSSKCKASFSFISLFFVAYAAHCSAFKKLSSSHCCCLFRPQCVSGALHGGSRHGFWLHAIFHWTSEQLVHIGTGFFNTKCRIAFVLYHVLCI